MNDLEQRMQKSVDALKNQLATIRTGRANPDILSRIFVDYYGSQTPLRQLAAVTVPENTLLVVTVFDKSTVKDVEKAILKSDIGITPAVDGTTIRLRLPDLTEDRRKELSRQIKKQVEAGKVTVRNLRRDVVERIKTQQKDKEISEDDSRREQENVQKITEDCIRVIDTIAKEKESEIMSI